MLTLASITESICGTNGCDAGETILGVALIFAILVAFVALVSSN